MNKFAKILKKAGIVIIVLLAIIIVFLLILTIVHRMKLNAERERIMPIGHLVEVNGHSMNVYIEGNNTSTPILVFLSGSGTTAPIYNFKPLFSLLSDEYRVAVVERAGYGYSEITNMTRDIDTVLSETRMALSLAGEQGPYILIPHSMSGLEALRWVQLYPSEVKGIIGIDMAVPSAYENMNDSSLNHLNVLRTFTWIGIQRLYPPMFVSSLSLTNDEYLQAKLLTYRNAINKNIIDEANQILYNAQTVKDGGIPDVPILMLVSNGLEIGEYWIPIQDKFANDSNAQLEHFECGHYIHQEEPEKIAVLCREFIAGLC